VSRLLLARRLVLLGAAGLFLSLFLPWSHQFSHAFLVRFRGSALLAEVPHDPTGWQVYSAMDVALALLAAAMVAACLFGSRRVRLVTIGAGAIALAFTVHALSVRPTNGANLVNPSQSVPNYLPSSATAGPGETLALLGIGVALLGLVFTLPPETRRPLPPETQRPLPPETARPLPPEAKRRLPPETRRAAPPANSTPPATASTTPPASTPTPLPASASTPVPAAVAEPSPAGSGHRRRRRA
jgi:hypothetical protein